MALAVSDIVTGTESLHRLMALDTLPRMLPKLYFLGAGTQWPKPIHIHMARLPVYICQG